MIFVDSHAHLDFNQFAPDREKAIQRALSCGVEKIVNVACSLESSQTTFELAKKFKSIISGTVGIHPHEADKIEVKEVLDCIKKFIHAPEIVAIGEIGLDWFKKYSGKENQKLLFREQLELAWQFSKPVICHIRDAYDEAYQILSQYISQGKDLTGVIHCFSADFKTAQQFIDLGFYISFTGIITFPQAAEVRETVKRVPLQKILIETDCPYLSPVPHRGKRNEPAFVKEIAEEISKIKKVSLATVAEETTQNAFDLFGLQ